MSASLVGSEMCIRDRSSEIPEGMTKRRTFVFHDPRLCPSQRKRCQSPGRYFPKSMTLGH
eukprot:15437930-Alexandrium_andersonii.AAC.1